MHQNVNKLALRVQVTENDAITRLLDHYLFKLIIENIILHLFVYLITNSNPDLKVIFMFTQSHPVPLNVFNQIHLFRADGCHVLEA
jgi:hypothetical protein